MWSIAPTVGVLAQDTRELLSGRSVLLLFSCQHPVTPAECPLDVIAKYFSITPTGFRNQRRSKFWLPNSLYRVGFVETSLAASASDDDCD